MMKRCALYGKSFSIMHSNANDLIHFSYASRTKNIRNTPMISEKSSYALLRQYAEEIQRLRALLNSSTRLSRSRLSTENKSDHHHLHHHRSTLSSDISFPLK